MPVYEYELIDGSCAVCKGRFELRRPAKAPPLAKCPLCKRAVRKVISCVNVLRMSDAQNLAAAKEHGFTVLKRRDHAVYEKQ